VTKALSTGYPLFTDPEIDQIFVKSKSLNVDCVFMSEVVFDAPLVHLSAVIADTSLSQKTELHVASVVPIRPWKSDPVVAVYVALEATAYEVAIVPPEDMIPIRPPMEERAKLPVPVCCNAPEKYEFSMNRVDVLVGRAPPSKPPRRQKPFTVAVEND
jgi:hypothetical protein